MRPLEKLPSCKSQESGNPDYVPSRDKNIRGQTVGNAVYQNFYRNINFCEAYLHIYKEHLVSL